MERGVSPNYTPSTLVTQYNISKPQTHSSRLLLQGHSRREGSKVVPGGIIFKIRYQAKAEEHHVTVLQVLRRDDFFWTWLARIVPLQ